eukprot:TRINITY_DN6580_c0_g1_i2.p1 TRINITY_DN6580_c0_g1~~TRINITY_DN6580_c0_g1_i2.p1  ORF type:complete len:492 (-),score=114.85 TRINITY_DN6580_c0_g1_i2:25-1500(-)
MDALIDVAKLIKNEDLNEHIFSILYDLTSDEKHEEHHVESATLLNELAPILGYDICSTSGIELYIKLEKSSHFRVRKAVASNIENICSVLGPDKTKETILPLFTGLCEDSIWGVRKACAESLVVISTYMDSETRNSRLVTIFKGLIQDKSRWVRSAAFQALGHFISTFEGDNLDSFLFESYLDMAVETKEFGNDNVYSCAYNFPAVLHTIGAERWDELSEVYSTLVSNEAVKVRRSLSFSLHVIADILGQEVVEESLISTFDIFLKDLSEVRIGVITNLAQFLKILCPETRSKYLNIIKDIAESEDWRFRRLITLQLHELSKLYEPEFVFSTIIPSIFCLIRDDVAAVRAGLYNTIGLILADFDTTLGGTTEGKQELLDNIKSMAFDKPYKHRITFTKLCIGTYDQLSTNLYETEFLLPLLKLASDKVPNVRACVAKALATLNNAEYYADDERITEKLEELQKDSDRDVVLLSGGTWVKTPKEVPTACDEE